MRLISPYERPGRWLKGNLHAHTENSPCGHYPLRDVAGVYGDRIMKYDFLAITDHCFLTDVAPARGGELVVLSGVEYKKEAYQTLGINIRSYNDDGLDETNHQAVFDETLRQGGINIICHPHIYRDDYWPLDRLLALEGYGAVEIYNNNVRMNNAGRAVATDLWDALLTAGRRVGGIASDDFHHSSRCGGGFIMALCGEKSLAGVVEAVRQGAYYASSGVLLDIRAAGAAVTVTTALDAAFRFIGRGGRVLAATGRSREASYTARGDEGYVRVEALREDGAQAWTAPFWVE